MNSEDLSPEQEQPRPLETTPNAVAVVVEFELTRPEFESAVRRITRHTRSSCVFAGIAGLCALFGVLTTDAWSLIWGLCVFAWIFVLCPKVQWRTKPLVRSHQHVRISDDGIEARLDDCEGRLAWSFYRKALEYPDMFLLVTKSAGSTVIPKRAVGDGDEQRVRTIVSRHLPVSSRSAAGES